MRSAVAFLLPVALIGCGHSQSAADRSVEQLRGEMAKVQADHDRLEQRLGALEADQTRLDKERAPRPDASAARARPPLKVVRIDETGAPAAADTAPAVPLLPGEGEALETDEEGERPVVSATGVRVPGRAGRGGPSALSPEAGRDYDGALALVKGKQYDKAIDQFAAFLVRYPDHPHANNAMYWRGECFYAKGDYARAAQEFEGLIARFPVGTKVPDAMLKLGMTQKKLGQDDRAEKTFAQLRERYPNSQAARQLMRR
jgi:tol-pal system protein YbgF